MKVLKKLKQREGGETYPIRAEYMSKHNSTIPTKIITASPDLNHLNNPKYPRNKNIANESDDYNTKNTIVVPRGRL